MNVIPSLDITAQNKTWFNSLDVGKRDDVADAILIGLYWVEKGSSKVKKESKKRKRNGV